MRGRGVILLFAKAPRLGCVKTRLEPLLGAHGALAFYRGLLRHIQTTLSELSHEYRVQVWSDAPHHPEIIALARRLRARAYPQCAGHLGQRMAHAMATAQRQYQSVVLVGADCPSLQAQHLRQAFEALAGQAKLVLSPVEDGGYCLIGSRHCHSRWFSNMPWSTPQVLMRTLERQRALGSFHLLPTLWDVDDASDWPRLQKSYPHLSPMAIGEPAPQGVSCSF